jgi:hypothetical protein
MVAKKKSAKKKRKKAAKKKPSRRKKASKKMADKDIDNDVILEDDELEIENAVETAPVLEVGEELEPTDEELKEIEFHDTEPPPPPEPESSPPAEEVYPEPVDDETVILDGFVLGDEEEIRDFALAVCEALLPSEVGAPQFEWMTQGRSRIAKLNRKLFSTCGELAMCVLYCIGYRGTVLNRDLSPVEDGAIRKYQYGQNMAWICGNSRQSRAAREKLWVKCRPLATSPNPGDILFVSNGPPRTEHVSIFVSSEANVDGTEEWTVWQAGQGGVADQHGSEGTVTYRVITGHGRPIARLNDRQLHGWIDIGALAGKLNEKARMPPSF